MTRFPVLVLAVVGLVPAAARADDPKPGPVANLLTRVTLGMAVEELPNDGPHGGVVVRHVTKDGPAAKAGLKTGDIIVRVSNMQVDDFDELVGAVAGHKAGDELSVAVLRDDQPVRLTMTLGAPAKGDAARPEGCRSCAYLGVITVPTSLVHNVTTDRLGITDDKGLVVIDVVPGSPAAGAGLRHGDVIRSINGTEVRDADALRTHVKDAGTGTEVTLTVRRGDATREVKAALAEGPCDVLLYTPKRAARGGEEVEQLRERVQQLEARLQRLEGKREPTPEK